MKKIKIVKGVAYPHEYLWRAALRCREAATQGDKASFHFLALAALSSYLAFESFINYLGQCLDPQAWKDEKTFFNQSEYYGIEGKVKRIVEKLPDYEWKKGERPYQSIMEVRKFRNLMVHGKPYSFNKTIEIKNEEDEERVELFEFDWEEFISIGNIERYMSHIKEFCESLRCQASVLFDDYDKDTHLFSKAFEGGLAHSEGTTKTILEPDSDDNI